MGAKTGPATKGSRQCLQQYVNDRQKQSLLNDLLLSSSAAILATTAVSVEWLSPLAALDYREHRDDFLDVLGLKQSEHIVRDFWPEQGPQWDGLARLRDSAGESAVILVEAKAHPAETESSLMATAPDSIAMIGRAFARTQGYMGVTKGNWTDGAYQLANRLAFLYCMNELVGVPTYLVLVNFVGDKTYRPTSLSEWQAHYRSVFQHLGLQPGCRLLDRIALVFPPAP
ncbi:MAG TPA: hypothetical protein VD969_04690 [Symbiobacteriaceae bacterium]|nr:hypothetical protein [Symbiobacteriaceae bacterium]